MRKIFLFTLVLFCLFAANTLHAQCSVTISTNTNTTQLNCTHTAITLTANAEATTNIAYLWSTAETGSSIVVTEAGVYEVTIITSGGCTTKTKITITKDVTVPNISIRAFPERICVGDSSTLVAIGANSYVWQPPINPALEVVTVKPTITTSYTVTGTGLNGCTSSRSFELVVNPLPSATIEGAAFICQNKNQDFITFTGQNGTPPYTFSYRINNGATQSIQTGEDENSVRINSTTEVLGSLEYKLLSVRDANGCEQNQSGSINVTVLPLPLMISSKFESICDNASFHYTAESSVESTSFIWSRPVVHGISNSAAYAVSPDINETLNNTTHLPKVVNYIFRLYNSVGCVTEDTLKVTVNPTPVISTIADTTFCNGNFASAGIPFTSSSPNVAFRWTNSDTSIGLPASGSGNIPPFIAKNATGQPITATITVFVKASADSCEGSSEIFTITVRPAPVFTSRRLATVCDDVQFIYTATSSATGTLFNWSRPAVPGIANPAAIANSPTINEALNNTTSQPVEVAYIFTLSTGSGCVITDTVKLTVNPSPVINPIADTTFCNGIFASAGIPFSSGSPGAVFRWTNSNPNIGLAASGSGSIPAFIATNSVGNDITATITVFVKASADSCVGTSRTFTITVRPAPVFTSPKSQSVCDDAPFSYTATSTASSAIFSWKRTAVAGISNSADSAISSTINETLNNITTQPVEVEYIFTLSTGTGCVTTETLKVTVNPIPVTNTISDTTFCNGTFASAGIPFTSTTPGAVFSWTNSNPNIGLPSSGTGSIPAFFAINTSGSNITATITVFVKANADSCVGAPRIFTISVRPAPVFTSLKSGTVCDDSPFSYTATSSASGAIFMWERPMVSGITNPAENAISANIIETLNNITTQPVEVAYIYMLSTGTGCITTDTLKVTVNPTPELDPTNNVSYCNGTLVSGISFSSTSPNPSFSWTCVPSIGFGTSGSGNIPTFFATNRGTDSIQATVTVGITASSDNCQGPDKTFKITVLPAPVLLSAKEVSVCDTLPFKYTAISSASGTSFSWRRPAVAGISNPAGSGNAAVIDEKLDNIGDQRVIVNYIFTLSTGTGCIITDTLKVTVNPTPELNPTNNVSYCNSTPVPGISFSSTSPDPSFTWTCVPSVGFGTSGSGNIPPFFATNSGSDPINATVTVSITASSDNCVGLDRSFQISVLPAPVLTSSKTSSICDNNPFAYTATSSATGTTFSWARPVVTGISNSAGSGTTAAISETLDNTTSDPVVVNYVFTMTTGTGCVTTDTLKVTVNPTPVINPLSDIAYCNGTPVPGISFGSLSPNPTFTWTCVPSIGFGTSGTGNIPAFFATNSGSSRVNATVTVSITASSENCPGPNASFQISVLPTPVLTSSKTSSICDNIPFAYTATSSATGTTFSWTRPVVTGISNSSGSGTTAGISETLNNTTSDPVVVNYVFTMTTGTGCVTNETVAVTVNPTPVINTISNTTFCNGTLVSGISFGSLSPNPTFTWTCTPSIGFGTSGTGNIPGFIASNSGSDPINATVTVSITASSNNCVGLDRSFQISVLPTPILTSSKTNSICDNIPFAYTATSSATGTTFSWTRPVVTGISNSAGTGNTAGISETLDNTTSDPVVVNYVFTLSTGPGCITNETVGVTVNPTPVINPISNRTFCNGTPVPGISFGSLSPNPTFAWTCTPSIGFGTSGTGNIPGFIATNSGSSPITATVTVSIKASSDNCPGTDTSFVITVNPSPQKPLFTSLTRNEIPLELCNGSENINFNINNPLPGYTYNWILGNSGINAANIIIKDTNDPHTVISFREISPTDTIKAIAINDPANGSCRDTVFQKIEVKLDSGITERRIFLKEPGPLLIYPDNSLNAYQWGFDRVISVSPDTSSFSFGTPNIIQNQRYQFFTPDTPFLNGNKLNDTAFLYWVLLKNNEGCISKVYYNGPYRPRAGRIIEVSNPVELLVFPNPNRGNFEISLKGNIYGNISVKIYNALGQQVFTKKFVKMAPEIYEKFNTSQLSSGIYFLELNSSDLKKVVTRFIIQH